MEQKPYFLGLDIGTDSVGWAVTDTEYRIRKENGKALWGVRLFDSAETAEERRNSRVSRRRIERRRQRCQWLEEVFSEAIGSIDPAFFQRLRESKFQEEDKQADFPLGKYTLFGEKDYSDKTYYREYPTIYHLRKALIESEKTFDVRLVYLAVHHIMKYRGHFLYGDLSLDMISPEAGLERLQNELEREFEQTVSVKDFAALRETLTSHSLNKTQKKKKLSELFGVSKKDGPLYAVTELLSGAKVSLDSLYGEKIEAEDLSKISLEDDFDTIKDKLMAILDDRIELILAIKEIYDWALLESIRSGERYLSVAKVKSYEKHKADLLLLKQAVKQTEDKELYREIFHISKKGLNNYPAYSGKDAKNYRCNSEDFGKYLIKKLKPYQDKIPTIADIFVQLEEGTFLPKQTTKDNGIIPHQLHELELVKILENASAYLPFLLEKDESGLTKAEQIHQMFCFQVPYYVGPLNADSAHSWIVRKEEKIYPWNFSQIVDLEQCRENFITRMTAKCSYIGEDVLPKSSLLYSKYMVLNEINKLKVNGSAISVQTKQNIYRDLFLTGKKVSHAKLRTYLNLDKEDIFSGLDGDVSASLAMWKQYEWLLEKSETDGFEIAEDIIRHITLFGKDKKLLAGWIAKTYGDILTLQEQKRALSVPCSGWGKLSRAFLTEIYHIDPQTGEASSIMDLLWNTNDNLMELLGGKYTFGQAVAEYRAKKRNSQGETLQEYLDESYASPSIKRAIHQTIAIVGELEGIMKCPPKRIFVEMARDTEKNGKKGIRTVSRKQELTALYEKCGEECNALYEQLSDLSDGALRRDKLYLYYTQMGKCMYSGEAIDLNRLESDYDIDHIYPQSKTKDDSIHNRVLVRRNLNADKSDNYPISSGIRQKMQPFWTMLRKKELISAKKYERLIRTTGFSVEEQAGFIARQLVETRQSCKIVAELLGKRFGNQTEIVYVKAGNVSDFRRDQRITKDGIQKMSYECKKNEDDTDQDPVFVKCRDVNDFHHAKDAYLNIVVGNVYHLKFTKNPIRFVKEQQQNNRKYSLNRVFAYDVLRNGEKAWTAGTQGSIDIVRKTMRKNNILFTRRASQVKGCLFDQQIVPKGQGQASIKSSDPRMSVEKYGGYNKISGAYFTLVEHTNKKKRIRSLEAVYLMNREMYEKEPERYCREVLGLEQPKVLIPKIKINSLVSYDGFRMHISGRTGLQIIYKNANPLIIAPEWHVYVKNISKYLERCRQAGKDLEITSFDKLSAEQNQALYDLLVEKLENTVYGKKFETPANTLKENRQPFAALCVPNQCRILIQIFNLFANNSASADLKLLNGKAGIGILYTSKNLNNRKEHTFRLIHQSVTGFFEQEVDLLAEEIR